METEDLQPNQAVPPSGTPDKDDHQLQSFERFDTPGGSTEVQRGMGADKVEGNGDVHAWSLKVLPGGSSSSAQQSTAVDARLKLGDGNSRSEQVETGLDEHESLLIKGSNQKVFLMRVRYSDREMSSDDEEDGVKEDNACRRVHGMYEWFCKRLRRRNIVQLCCCRSINLLRLGDYFWLRWLCCCVRKQDVLHVRVPVKSVDGLFDNDSPFAFPRINQDVLEYIIQKTWDQLSYGQTTRITVETLNSSDITRAKELEIAFSNTFRYESKMQTYELIQASADGTATCLMATIIVLIMLAILIPIHVNVFAVSSADLPTWLLVIDGIIIIIFWVVVWHPIDILVFGRHMIRMRRALCRTLSESPVSIVVIDPEKPADVDYEFAEIQSV